MDQENTNIFNKDNDPEKENTSRYSITRKVGGFALRVVEVVACTGAAWATQELVFHDSLPLAVNVAIAGGATTAIYASSKKR